MIIEEDEYISDIVKEKREQAIKQMAHEYIMNSITVERDCTLTMSADIAIELATALYDAKIPEPPKP